MRGNVYLLQEVHLRDEEDAAVFTREWGGRVVGGGEEPLCNILPATRGCGAPADRAEVARWVASLAYLHGRLNRGEPVDWAVYEGAKERLRGLLEARAKALAFQAQLRELEEGERPTAYFFQAAKAQSYYAKLFSRRACDPAAEARLLDCVSARLGSEEAQAMEADVTLEEVRRAVFSTVDGVRLPVAAGEVLKIQQYADDTTLFVSSARSLGRIRALTDLFGAGTGSRVNMAKSSVLFCGRWTEDIGDSGGFAVCEGGLKILGVRFWPRGSAAQNWEARLALVRSRLGVWSRRQLSLMGKVVVVRSVLLPLLLHLAYVFPVPARAKLALTRAVFAFLWGGRYECVSRELMCAPVAGGGCPEGATGAGRAIRQLCQ
ncbi:hypothetical protein AAFF_G00374170 [Aldrovandia affinis]|uniref:Reverse transcriptase domain-containing protein n=1 Tax=Aldrovandia affinis TaxID=143900 RepID=A0AAD7R4Z5_9TELE|nr:hypothetical protein AAFF_G00374170 [Aldrovandia affinis]